VGTTVVEGGVGQPSMLSRSSAVTSQPAADKMAISNAINAL
jgi:hypothetical protein